MATPLGKNEEPSMSKKPRRFTQGRHRYGRQHLAVSTRLQERCQGVVEVLSAPSYKTNNDRDDAKRTKTEAQGENPKKMKPHNLYPCPPRYIRRE